MDLRIGELARITKETVKTLRYWTDLGLLEAQRGENGYRYYSPEASKRVRFIRNTQGLGFNLEAIKGILSLRDEGLQPCDEVREELAAHLSAVRQRLAELKTLEAELAARLQVALENPDPNCDEVGCVYLDGEGEVGSLHP